MATRYRLNRITSSQKNYSVLDAAGNTLSGAVDTAKSAAGGLVKGTGDIAKSGIGQIAGAYAGAKIAGTGLNLLGKTIGGAGFGLLGKAAGAIIGAKVAKTAGQALHDTGNSMKY